MVRESDQPDDIPDRPAASRRPTHDCRRGPLEAILGEHGPVPLDGSKHWTSYLRTCRPVWDLAVSKHRKPAELVRQEIQDACAASTC